MKQFSLVLSFLFLLTFSLQAQQDVVVPVEEVQQAAELTEPKNGPIMTFDSLEVDYGTIEQHSDPFRVFTFTNTGNEPLLITNARGSCGCTVPSYSKAPIAPGESSEIKVRYATDRIGQFRKRVTLTTNAGGDPVVLTIKGKVNKKEAEPEAVPESEAGMFNNNGNN